MLATLDSSIKQHQPVVVTLWQPHWAFSRYPLKVLEDPKGVWGPPDQMQIIATKGWSAANPEVAGWLKNFSYVFPIWGSFSFSISLRLDGRVVGVAIVLIAIASVATGLAPALYASSPALAAFAPLSPISTPRAFRWLPR